MGHADVRFVKGHGTENDFVVIPDAEGELDLTPRLVAAVCDRRAGIGADGVLRVVRSSVVESAADQAGLARWFMDYRNADGSLAEMCGNGVRVFARFLVEAGLADPDRELPIATRSGVKTVRFESDGQLTADIGPWTTPRVRAAPLVEVDGKTWPATGILLPNPHAVVFVDNLDDAGELKAAPHVVPPAAFPDGVNVEFVVTQGDRHIAMRVFERGVGETRSCGTGACAAMLAAARRDGEPAPVSYRVDVPGGSLVVTERADGHVELTGPAVLLAEGVLHGDWVEGHQ